MVETPHIPPQSAIGKKALGFAHGTFAYLNVPPNLHRLRNAVGLTVGLYTGRKLMNILAGETPEGKKIDPKDLIAPLRPLCGVFAYNHFSDDPGDRWKKVVDMSMPAVFGGIGAAMGSVSFYKDGPKAFMNIVPAKMKVGAAKFTMADAEREALFHEARPAALAASTAAGGGSSAGVGLYPSFPFNYSLTLGWLFSARAERQPIVPWLSKKMRAALFNTHGIEPFRPTRLLDGKILDQLVENPSLTPKNFEATAEGLLNTWFRRIKPEQIEKFKKIVLEERNNLILAAKAAGESPAEVEKEIRAHMSEFLNFASTNPKLDSDTAKALQERLKRLGTRETSDIMDITRHHFAGIEKRFIDAGIDPREAAIGDVGMLTAISRWCGDMLGFGTTEKMLATQAKMIKGLEERHGKAVLDALHTAEHPFIPPDITKTPTAAKIGAGAIAAAGVGTVYAISNAKDPGIADLNPAPQDAHAENETKSTPAFTERVGGKKHIVHSKKQRGLINGKVLDTAEGITGMFNAAIGMHRVHCAIGLTAGSWLGDKAMEAMTGRTFAGKHVSIDDVARPLRSLYKILPFNPNSDHPNDKWLQVLRWAVPAITGTAAVIQGSRMFFEERHEKMKKAVYLDEVEDKATMAQSQPWSYTAAVSGLFGFPSGLPMLPLVNYSTNLGTRFSMGSGRKVALPGIGKIWSNNNTLFPFGPAGMTKLIIREAVNNKARDPELLETYAIGVLKPWFDNVTPEQIESFVMKIHDVRDKYFKEGGVPADLKKQLEGELKAHFTHAGLEETIREIGLDPLNATIASNGLSGSIANALGAKSAVEKIRTEYKHDYLERIKNRHEAPAVGHGIST